MRLKIWLSILVLLTSMQAADNSKLLSALKQEKLDIDKKQNQLESDNLQYDWVNQIMGNYSYTDSDQMGYTTKSDLFSITMEQPFFRSGGIYYAIQYSGANREFLELSTKLSEQTLIKNLIASWLAIKRFDLQIQRQEYLIKNAQIDIIRKKEQYENGFLDSSFLDNAILSKSNLRKALIDMESARYEKLMSFEKLSDMDYTKINPPTFSMVDLQEYAKKSLAIEQQRAQIQRKDYLKKMQIANYLPTFSFFGGIYKSEEESFRGTKKDSYNRIGIKVSMPLFAINRGRTIEIQQLEYLKSKLELQDVKKEETKNYQQTARKIDLLKKRIAIAKEDVELYDSLLLNTRELYSAGEKTVYDVDTLRNSKRTMMLDKAIYEVDVQLALLELYAKMNGEI